MGALAVCRVCAFRGRMRFRGAHLDLLAAGRSAAASTAASMHSYFLSCNSCRICHRALVHVTCRLV
eukprot:15433609-Alexandrium_andersonii.AAC.1